MPGDHHNMPSFAKISGWSGTVNGWSKLKDRIPDHEKTLAHQKFYVAWKSRISKGVGPGLVDTLFAQKIQAEVKNCRGSQKNLGLHPISWKKWCIFPRFIPCLWRCFQN